MCSEFQRLRASLFKKRETIASELDRYNETFEKWRKLNTGRGRAITTADDNPEFLLAARRRRILEQVIEHIDGCLQAATAADALDETAANILTSRWERLAVKIDELDNDQKNHDQASISNG